MIELNIKLRNPNLNPEYATRLNGVFKQLTGHDHESVDPAPPLSASWTTC